MNQARPYLGILAARFRMGLQYRAAAIAGLGTQVFFGFVRLMIFAAFYRSVAGEQPMSFPEVVTYIWLGQALLGFLPWRGDPEIAAMIREGAVSYELARPLDLYHHWYMRVLAWRTSVVVLRCVPMVIFAMFLLPLLGASEWALATPPTWQAAGLFTIALIGIALLSAALTTLLNISMMWTLAGEGINRLVPSIVNLCSGLIIPIPLMPDWLGGIITLLPFRGLADVPFRIYAGHIAGVEALGELALMYGWIALLVMLGRAAVGAGARRLVIQGG